MEKNRVTFETARKLKDFGYTQDWYNGCVLYDKNRELVVYNIDATAGRKSGLKRRSVHC